MILFIVIPFFVVIYAILAKIVVKIVFKALDWESKDDRNTFGVELQDYEHTKKWLLFMQLWAVFF